MAGMARMYRHRLDTFRRSLRPVEDQLKPIRGKAPLRPIQIIVIFFHMGPPDRYESVSVRKLWEGFLEGKYDHLLVQRGLVDK